MFRVSDGGSSIDDCERFLDPNASWAAKAADLGWDAGLAEAGMTDRWDMGSVTPWD
jgi:hypothetical protein